MSNANDYYSSPEHAWAQNLVGQAIGRQNGLAEGINRGRRIGQETGYSQGEHDGYMNGLAYAKGEMLKLKALHQQQIAQLKAEFEKERNLLMEKRNCFALFSSVLRKTFEEHIQQMEPEQQRVLIAKFQSNLREREQYYLEGQYISAPLKNNPLFSEKAPNAIKFLTNMIQNAENISAPEEM